MPWNTDVQPQAPVTIRANGETFTRSPGDNFRETVLDIAEQVGFGKFTVTLNGRVLETPDQAPDTFAAGDTVEITPYNVPG